MRSISTVILLAAACGTTTRFAATNAAPHPLVAHAPEQVEVFATGLPPRPFVEVGIIEARQSSAFSSHHLPEIIAQMRTDAGRRGCDGLVLNGPRDGSAAVLVPSGQGSTAIPVKLEGFWGACIVFVAPEVADQR